MPRQEVPRHGRNILLLDELLAGLNAAESERAVQLVRQIEVRGVTVAMIEQAMRQRLEA